ncbi:MAG: hypothetical protein COV57_00280 [Candidatus Liptonbacteria bacterium CG11_big_fil_rev_8_21_14_0_20_35_14]|uniref:Uncharacterized protein n=1 Tax=Candidatus Liptonbacteria bacterium CG11_big_fil_rev_8_21_14_0_20_35_14 TaxID=1974634 RepID=A0A2H0NAV2_9BACT|nr:MAG: hypothetical protein COV57_00280 [Candidatus Liptonbacteria bacterium CG11_big_fil_rev_8_21_14_0_20_35_14]
MDNNLREKILAKIRNKEIKMVPRSYFILRSLLYFVTTLFFFVLAVFLLTFVFYVFKINGILSLPYFGLKGVRDFLLSLPLLLLVITLLFFGVAALFLKKHPVTYRRPLIYSVGALLVIFSVGTVLIVKTGEVRRSLYMTIEKNNIPFVSDFYDEYKMVGARNVTLGRVVSLYDEGIEINSRDRGKRYFVAFGPQTSLYSDKKIEVGDYVIVHGRKNGHTIGAFVVERVRE